MNFQIRKRKLSPSPPDSDNSFLYRASTPAYPRVTPLPAHKFHLVRIPVAAHERIDIPAIPRRHLIVQHAWSTRPPPSRCVKASVAPTAPAARTPATQSHPTALPAPLISQTYYFNPIRLTTRLDSFHPPVAPRAQDRHAEAQYRLYHPPPTYDWPQTKKVSNSWYVRPIVPSARNAKLSSDTNVSRRLHAGHISRRHGSVRGLHLARRAPPDRRRAARRARAHRRRSDNLLNQNDFADASTIQEHLP